MLDAWFFDTFQVLDLEGAELFQLKMPHPPPLSPAQAAIVSITANIAALDADAIKTMLKK